MAESLKKIGPLYKSVGLDTPLALITQRIEAAAVVLPMVDSFRAITLVRLAFSLPVDSTDLAWFVEPFQDKDPTFAPNSNDREVSLLASSVLDAVMRDQHEAALPAALGYVCCSVGGLRSVDSAEDLSDLATTTMQREQQRSAPSLSQMAELERITLPSLTKPVQEAGAQNDVNILATAVAEALTATLKPLRANDRTLLAEVNRLSSYVSRLNEQMQQQWWVFAGWSSGGAKPFRELDLAEAALRAGIELAKLTELPAGPLSAPALLDALLSGAGHDPQKMLQIGATVEAAAMQWRKEWAPDIVGTPVELLCPVTLAAALAAASDDQADWKQRFYRESGLRATAKLPSRALAEQVHRERLLLRLCKDQEA